MIIVFLALFHSVFALAQFENYGLDWKYHAGNNLVYDCERMHYACVDKDGFENCREERNYARGKKLDVYPCAPLKRFASKKECLEEQYKVVDLGAKKRFCYPQ